MEARAGGQGRPQGPRRTILETSVATVTETLTVQGVANVEWDRGTIQKNKRQRAKKAALDVRTRSLWSSQEGR